MVGKIHKKKISEYTEAAENDDKQSDRGDEADEMILDHVEPVPSGSESENGDNANNEHNKSSDSVNANDDAGVSDDVPTGLNYDTDYNSAAEADEDEGKKAKKRKASKKATDVESDDEPLNGGSPKKKRSKSGGKAKGAVKGKAKAKKASSNKDDDGEDEDEGDDGEEEEYEVKDIVGHKTERGVSYFLIRWKGYTKADDTWEPEETLSCPEIIERYKKKQKQSPKKGSTPVKKKGGKAAAGRGNKKPVDEEQEWEVEKIIDYAVEKKGRVFRIRWKGFGPKNDTWEPEENLNCDDIIQKFLAKMKSQENVSFKELREEPKKTKRLVNETAPRTNIHNPIGRKSKRAITKKRVFYGDMDE